MGISEWVVALTEQVFGKSAMKIGHIVKHPDGRYVQVIDGCMWAEAGYCNFWFWREVRYDGTLGRLEYGYGWNEPPQGHKGDNDNEHQRRSRR